MTRKRYGMRNSVAVFQEHDGDGDVHGNPTYTKDSDWVTTVPGWPAEKIATTGGETVRGRQINAKTTHVLYGEYYGAENVTAAMRCVVDGKVYGVVSVLDLEGRNRELRIELRSVD